MPKTEKRGIRLEVKAVGDKALKSIAGNIDKVAKSSRSVQRNFSNLRNVFLGVFAAKGLKEVVRMADSIQLLGDRITAFTGDTESGARALDLLFDAANRTNSEVDTLADGFNRVALATQELRLSTEQMIAFTTTLQNAFRIQGASAAESRGAIIQLTQGLASGALRGQELRSVLEASAVAGSVLADAVGISRGELIKFAETGALTSEVVLKAFSKRTLELDERAGKLGTTFGQTLTKATNEFKRGLNELNKDLELNKQFEITILGATRAIKELFVTVAKNKAFQEFTKGLGAFVKGSANILSETFGDQSELEKLDKKLGDSFNKIDKIKIKLSDLKKDTDGFLESTKRFFVEGTQSQVDTQIKRLETRLSEEISLNEKLFETRSKLIDQEKNKTKSKGSVTEDSISKILKDFSNADFDKLANKGALTIEQLNRLFQNGKININQYRKAILELEKQDLAKQFSEGKIRAEEYNKELIKVNIELARINGNLNVVSAGARKYAESVGDFSTEIVGAVENAFGTLEDKLFDFVKTGKFLFNDFAQAVLDDITRILIRTQLIKPLVESISGGFSSGTGTSVTSTPATPKAKGGIFSGGDFQAFAQGGVVNAPTFFPTRSGTGLMGEAGPEAIIPLERVSGGDLGVKAIPGQTIVNINNQTGAEIEVSESADGNTKVLDITITRAVKNAINSGSLDKAFSSSFGLNRKGSR